MASSLTTPETLAAIDVGTNSIHLVVARVTGADRFEVVAREKHVVRLGHGPGDMKQLEPDAIERGVDALARLRAVADAHRATVRAVATSAVREAANHDDFLARARRDAGVEVEVISGVEEARLIHLGVLQALPVFDRRLLLCDIGGGSTELLVGERGEVLAARSLKLGAVRLTGRFFPDGAATEAAVDHCRRHIRAMLRPFRPAVERHGFEVAVASSGTAEQVVRLAHRGDREPLRTWNGVVTSAEAIAAVTAEIARAACEGTLGGVDGIEPKRVDIVLAGSLILDEVIRAFGMDSVVFSEAALREGVLLDTLQRSREGTLRHLTDVARASVRHVADAFDDDPAHSTWVATLALQLFDATAGRHGLDPSWRDILEAAALLANVGLVVSHDGHHKHSYYVIRNSDRLLGFTDREIELIALVARYHRKSAPKASHPEFAVLDAEAQRVVRALAGILRIAIALDHGHDRAVSAVRVSQRDEDGAGDGEDAVDGAGDGAGDDDGEVVVEVVPAVVVEVDGVADGAVVVEVVPTVGADPSLEIATASERTGLLEAVLGAPVRVVLAVAPAASATLGSAATSASPATSGGPANSDGPVRPGRRSDRASGP
ncbi:MAG: Ppx/GppA family phosphatase [Actinobacteria bacterium]|nr:Ppx/GppA family phosphatase [Actinomycetota bacterium]